jgi:hypothetical protein
VIELAQQIQKTKSRPLGLGIAFTFWRQKATQGKYETKWVLAMQDPELGSPLIMEFPTLKELLEECSRILNDGED